jgi:hypothetical protein
MSLKSHSTVVADYSFIAIPAKDSLVHLDLLIRGFWAHVTDVIADIST